MKNKKLWIIIAVVVLILIIGYFTNWFGLGKSTITTSTTNTPAIKRTVNNSLRCATYDNNGNCTSYTV